MTNGLNTIMNCNIADTVSINLDCIDDRVVTICEPLVEQAINSLEEKVYEKASISQTDKLKEDCENLSCRIDIACHDLATEITMLQNQIIEIEKTLNTKKKKGKIQKIFNL